MNTEVKMSGSTAKRGSSTSPESLKTASADGADKSKKNRVTRSSKLVCRDCDQPIPVIEPNQPNLSSVICERCDEEFHTSCLGITSKYVLSLIGSGKMQWICFVCQQQSLAKFCTFQSKVDSINESFQDLSTQIYQLKNATAAYEQAVTALDNRVSEMEINVGQRLKDLQLQSDEIATNKSNVSDLIELRELVVQLTSEVDDLKAKSTSTSSMSPSKKDKDDIFFLRSLQRRDNLVIKGVPHQPGETEESLIEVVIRIGAACGINIEKGQVSATHRLRKRADKDNDRSSSDMILVKFKEQSTAKQKLFMSYIALIGQKKPLVGSNIGLDNNRRIYIDQHLSPELLKMKDKALLLKKANVIRKVIPRYNAIRVQVGDKWHQMTSLAHMEQLFQFDDKAIRERMRLNENSTQANMSTE